MQIEFVNHSSIIARHGRIALLMDYWQEGPAFDNSWKLLCEPKFGYGDLRSITHLWFSHEHPDHFSPANIKAIPPEIRKDIIVLFQKTTDGRVVTFCRNQGFGDVIELPARVPHSLSDDLTVTCAPYASSWGDVDSWLLVRTPGHSLLNINDCEIHDPVLADRIARITGPVDVLATQFSYASKQGNPEDERWIDRARRYHLDRLEFKVRAFSPTYTIPFASFVYWSHRESRYLNEGVVKVDAAAATIARCGSTPVVMFPGDTWNIGDEVRNEPALAKYAERYQWLESLSDDDYTASEMVSPESLNESFRKFLERMLKNASNDELRSYLSWRYGIRRRSGTGWAGSIRNFLRTYRDVLAARCESGLVYVDDHAQAYELSVSDGLRPSDHRREDCQISLSSSALHYCFTVPWGGESLQVNGRFRDIQPDGWRRLKELFFLARRIDQGFQVPRSTLSWIVSRKLRKLFGHEK